MLRIYCLWDSGWKFILASMKMKICVCINIYLWNAEMWNVFVCLQILRGVHEINSIDRSWRLSCVLFSFAFVIFRLSVDSANWYVWLQLNVSLAPSTTFSSVLLITTKSKTYKRKNCSKGKIEIFVWSFFVVFFVLFLFSSF